MEQWLQQSLAALPDGALYLMVVGLIALLESLLVIGILVPGSVLIVFCGFLAANGKGDPILVLCVAAAGSFAGDLLSFVLGARFGSRLLKTQGLKRFSASINQALALLRLHGAKAIFIGRFFGPLRPFIPFAAGSAKVSSRFFIGFDALACVLWGAVYPGLGYLFGTSWQRVQLWSGRLSLLAGGVIVCWLATWLFRTFSGVRATPRPPEEKDH